MLDIKLPLPKYSAKMFPDKYAEYRDARERWVHEDNLINHRVSWLLFSQSILFAAYAVVLATPSCNTYAQRLERISSILTILPLIGISNITVVLIAIGAASMAQFELTRKSRIEDYPPIQTKEVSILSFLSFISNRSNKRRYQEINKEYDKQSRGGAQKTNLASHVGLVVLGNFAAYAFPFFFFIAWVVLIVI